MGEPRIPFNQRWDKLKEENFLVGEEMTTARAYTPRKDQWYHGLMQRGERVRIDLKDNGIGYVKIKWIWYEWSNQTELTRIKSDTYEHWDHEDWDNFMAEIYKAPKVYLIWLEMDIIEVTQ